MPIPPTGTIRIVPGLVSQILSEFQSGTPVGNCAVDMLPALTNTAIITYLNADVGGLPYINSRWANAVYCDPTCFGLFPLGGIHKLIMSPATNGIIFNPGGSQIIADFLSSAFPMGILVTRLQVQWLGSARIFAAALDIIDFKLIYGNIDVFTNATPSYTNATVSSAVNTIIPAGVYKGIVSALSFFGVSATHQALSIIATGCGNFASSQAEFTVRRLAVIADYITWTSGLSIIPGLITPASTQSPTGPIIILDTNNKLNQLSSLFAYYRNTDGSLSAAQPITNITSQTAGSITFTLPSFTIPLGSSIVISGASLGPEFTGEVSLGLILNSTLVNASGIYKLVTEQKYDNYYDRSVTPVEPISVAIPTPFGRTGFF